MLAEQLCPVGQALLHAPQWLALPVRSTQAVPQRVRLLMHAGAPALPAWLVAPALLAPPAPLPALLPPDVTVGEPLLPLAPDPPALLAPPWVVSEPALPAVAAPP